MSNWGSFTRETVIIKPTMRLHIENRDERAQSALSNIEWIDRRILNISGLRLRQNAPDCTIDISRNQLVLTGDKVQSQKLMFYKSCPFTAMKSHFSMRHPAKQDSPKFMMEEMDSFNKFSMIYWLKNKKKKYFGLENYQ